MTRFLLLFLTVLSLPQWTFAEPNPPSTVELCQIDAGVSHEGELPVERIVHRYGIPGHYLYSMSLLLEGAAGLVDTTPIVVTINGRSETVRPDRIAEVFAAEILAGDCISDQSPALFYARSGDHLNVWEGSFGPYHQQIRFEQKRFSDLNFQ